MTTGGPGGPDRDLDGLVAEASRGDEEAWRELVGLYWRRVFAVVRSRCGRDDVAEEVAQSVFATVAEQLGAGGYRERGRFEAWLFRVAMNRLRDEMRRSRRHAEPVDPASLASIEGPARADDHGGRAGEFEALRRAIARLGAADREVIELRHHGGLGFKQIAELLGEPVGTLLARHHRALQKIRDLIAAEDARSGLERENA